MKVCQKCNVSNDDSSVFCVNCGSNLDFAAPQDTPNPGPQYAGNPQQGGFNPQVGQPYYAPPVGDPFDHTAEFSAKDISDNKVFAMLPYLLGTVGVIIILLLNNGSKFADFHLRQGMKFVVVNLLISIASLLLCWTFIVPSVLGILLVVLYVIKIICFFQVCKGQAKDAAIIRSLNFLK